MEARESASDARKTKRQGRAQSAEMLWIGSNGDERLGRRIDQQAADDGLVLPSDQTEGGARALLIAFDLVCVTSPRIYQPPDHLAAVNSA